MCALHSVLPNDYTLRYAGKVATFCSICLRKREACLAPASWLWDIIPLLQPGWLAVLQALNGKPGQQSKPFPAWGGKLCESLWSLSWSCAYGEGNGQPPSKQRCQVTSKQGLQLFAWKNTYNLFSHSKFRDVFWNRDHFPLNNISSAGAALHLSQIKMLYLCLIVIHSLVCGPRVLQGVSETHTVFLSATFCIRISDSVDRCVQSHAAVRQLPLDSVLEEEQEGKLFQLRSALT